MTKAPIQNPTIPTYFQRQVLERAATSRFGEPRLDMMPPHNPEGDPLTEFAIATIINPSINNLNDTDPGGPRFPGITISDPLPLALKDDERKERKARELQGYMNKILPTVIWEGLPFSTSYTGPKSLGIGNVNPSKKGNHRINLEERRAELGKRRKLSFMGESSSGKSALTAHLEQVAHILMTGQVRATIQDNENPLYSIRNRNVSRFDAPTAERFMHSLMNIGFNKNQLLLLELPATTSIQNIPENLRWKLNNNPTGLIRKVLMSLTRERDSLVKKSQLDEILNSFPRESVLFSSTQVDALSSNPEKAQGIVTPIAQDPKSKKDLIENFLYLLDLESSPAKNVPLNTNFPDNQHYLHRNLSDIFNHLPPLLRSIYAFGVLNRQEVIPMLLPLNQRIGGFSRTIDQTNLPELHQMLVLLNSMQTSDGIDKTKSQLSRLIAAERFDAESLAKHAINLCPDKEPILTKLIELCDFADTLKSIGENTNAAIFANTLYHSVISLVILAQQTNVIEFSDPQHPDLY